MFRNFFSLIISLSVLVAFSGCGEPPERSRDEILVWLTGSESQAQTVEKISKEFTEKTGIKVRCEAVSWGDAHSKYLTSIAGRVTPDIGTMGLTWGMEFGELGALVDLNDKFSEDLQGQKEKIMPSILEATQVGDRIYGIPFDVSVQVMYHRTDLVPEPPSNWDELVSVLKGLREEDRGMVIDWGSLEWIGYSPFLWQAGGSYYSDDLRRAVLDSPEAVKALEFFADLYKLAVPRTSVPLVQGLRTGDYPIAISGDWQLLSLDLGAPEIKGKWAVAPMPEGPAGVNTSAIGGRIFSIFSRSQLQEESWELIKFLSRPENQLRMYEASMETEDAYLPPHIPTWEILPIEDQRKEVLFDQVLAGKGPPPVRAWDSSARHVDHAIQRVILRDSDAPKELEKANTELQRELDLVR